MVKPKTPREKGKISLSKYFKEYKPGDTVAVSIELAEKFNYPKKIHGRTGKVISKRGAAYCVEIKDLNKPKVYILRPIHLKRIQTI